jgi:hypothetical protein
METITISPQRQLGDMLLQVTLEESHSDELTITSHPVEMGAAITDHAYANPSVVVIRAGWSNSSAEAAGDEEYVRKVYADLLTLQKSRVPFEIVTGKRLYRNMLMRGLGVTTDPATEAALFVTAFCQEVIIAKTQVVAVPPGDVHADPQRTAPTQNTGTVQPRPAVLNPRDLPPDGG